ncbi:MAG: hypothetical protein ACRDYX_02765 [Egibacteraceae bacterium]
MLGAALFLSVACGQLASAQSSTTVAKKRLQYIVIPHPDDEFSAWALIEKSAGNYPIFILLTGGEATRYCGPGGEASLQTHLGEYSPSPYPYVGRRTSQCEQARVNSWQRFLNDMAGVDPYLSYRPPYKGAFVGSGFTLPPTTVRSAEFKVWADDKSARVSFDLGDGHLTPEKVTWAIQTVRSKRSELFPNLPEYGVVDSAYFNTDDSRCVMYGHSDHRAVAEALFATDQGTPGPQWGRTCRYDPRVRRIDQVDDDTYEHAMYVDGHGYRHGFFQRAYGWLADVWSQGEDATTIWSRDQAFWQRF